jgi:L-xylulokinase
MSCYVGIDSGLTVTKAAVFDGTGRCLGTGAVPSRHELLGDGLVETDPEQQWQDVGTATRAALSTVDPAEIAAVGITAHGDNVYLVDAAGRPTRPALPSLDFRGAAIAAGWVADGTADALFDVLGELPLPHHVHATLRWLAEHEPDALERARWFLFGKDFLRLRLTGAVGTDATDATCGFADVTTGAYSPVALAACGLTQLADRLPPVHGSTALAGTVTAAAAEVTGLPAGLPVAYGLHDIPAQAVGSGLADTSTALLVAGTYSVNAVLTDRPVPGRAWLCRQWAEPGRWLSMSTSATSASNLTWLVEQLGLAPAGGYPELDAEVAAVLADETRLVFHPFLFGTPAAPAASASLLGLRPWHRRGHVYRAVLEGIAFSHRGHLETLAPCGPVRRAVLTGGAARSPVWAQLFADTLGLPVLVPDSAEAGALGAALCAAVATGAYPSLAAATAATVHFRHTYEPDPARVAVLAEAYDRFTATVAAAAPLWDLV